jgi:hypothetical protein
VILEQQIICNAHGRHKNHYHNDPLFISRAITADSHFKKKPKQLNRNPIKAWLHQLATNLDQLAGASQPHSN